MKKIWHETEKELPQFATDVVILAKNAHFYEVAYSPKYKAFNITEDAGHTEEEIEDVKIPIEAVDFWAYQKDLINWVENDI